MDAKHAPLVIQLLHDTVDVGYDACAYDTWTSAMVCFVLKTMWCSRYTVTVLLSSALNVKRPSAKKDKRTISAPAPALAVG